MTVKRWMVQDSVSSGAALASLEGEESDWLWLAALPEHGFQTLQGLAYALAHEVRRLQPDGPYCLAGKGVLGALAYEVGLQLRGMGQTVACVALEGAPAWIRQSEALAVERSQVSLPAWLRRCLSSYVPEPGDFPLQPTNMPASAEAFWRDLGAQASSRVPAHQPLVMLRQGRQSLPPLICVPGAGASVVDFFALSSALSYQGSVYGLQPRGLDGRQPPHVTVEDAARSYLDALRASAPGPVHLLGHSFGGWIAHELAAQLQSAGTSVLSLTVLDSRVPNDAPGEYGQREVLSRLIALYQQGCGEPLRLDAAELAERSAREQRKALHGELLRVGILPSRSSPDILSGVLRTFACALRAGYRPERLYQGPSRLVLVKPSEARSSEDAMSREQWIAGWRRWLPDLAFWEGPGNHITLLRSPQAGRLAAWLDEMLFDMKAVLS